MPTKFQEALLNNLTVSTTREVYNYIYMYRAPNKVGSFISLMPLSSANSTFYYLLESHRDDSNKWSKIGFAEEVTQANLEVDLTILYRILHVYL